MTKPKHQLQKRDCMPATREKLKRLHLTVCGTV